MNSIEKKALETYQTNIGYFSKQHKEVHKKITILTQAIEDGYYKEKYALEYKNGYFDVLELSSKSYLYNKDSNNHAQELAQQINYKKTEGVIEGFYNVKLSKSQVERFDETIDIHNMFFATAKIMDYHDEVVSQNNLMKDIFKFIFCNVGLGFHLKKIIDKVKPSIVFIAEENLELFRLSLFTTNYQELSNKSTLYISIMDSNEHFQLLFDEFFTQGYTHNQYLKYSLLTQDSISFVKKIQDYIVRSRHLIRPYSRQLRELLKAPEYLVEKYPFIIMSDKYLAISPFSNKPILIIASGPSLGKNLDWLHKNQDKFIIVSVLSSVKTLYTMNIKPDIVTHIDSDNLSVKLLSGIDKDDFFDKTIFIFSSVVSRNVIEAVPKERIFLFETGSDYKKGSKLPTVPSVGEMTYAIMLILGADQIYLLGLDLALDSKTKSTHSKEHIFSQEVKDITEQNEQVTSLRDTIFYVKGNFVHEVPTIALFHLSINGFSAISNSYKKNNQQVYNLGDGAYLQGADPLSKEELSPQNFDYIDKANSFEQATYFLKEISQNHPNQVDIDNIDTQLQEGERLLRLVHAFSNSAPTDNYLDYIKEFYKLYCELLNLNSEKKSDISSVFSLYEQLVVGYIFDIFNTANLKDEIKHIKNIHQIYSQQLIKILDLYCKTMKVYSEWIRK